ncbi:ABC transporter substrate-binding protein [Hoeflea prorocentri]|uniref:ABC transporter substrate-binding protein n=1 Tax=Hoeflea prorocentri TaxID=1922333 RepID=A0A9X3UF42_9HYPH|nr:ABC transporter substrate-binding protein [Hoeflea prorocentri]MCY6379384.1 ABC transporter substrate-binding protein [Hoeflea prorocentri]MDA5397185.1 ABC transporter substrate-binding protein [Hoeflea prorocentri]
MTTLRKWIAAAVIAVAPCTAMAEDLTIGMPIEPVMDPHYFWSSKYLQYYRHYLGFLVTLDLDAQVSPALAESWEAAEDGWTFKLRPDVRFSDGSSVDAEDVVASYERARNYPQAAGSYAGLFNNVDDIVAVDANTVRLETSSPYPSLGFAMTQVPIIPSEIAKSAEQADFNDIATSVSAGPYKLASYLAGQNIVLERNPDYWGEPAKFDNVTLRILPENSARMAALLAGDVDVIGEVPPEFVDRIRENEALEVHAGPSMRTVYLVVDQASEDTTPFATDMDGAPLSQNPFADKRVREALSLAIDREAIRDRVMNGLSFPTGQLVAKGVGGYSDDIAIPPYDPEKAKALLAEAGYPNGFKTKIHCTNDRYVNDGKICQALGQMFSRIGVLTEVETLPSSAFFPIVNQHPSGASMLLLAWSSAGSGEADVLAQTLRTYDADEKKGVWNLASYSNPELDALIARYETTIDKDERWALAREAMQLAVEDFAQIPIHDQSVIVGTRRDIEYKTTPEELTTAISVQ